MKELPWSWCLLTETKIPNMLFCPLQTTYICAKHSYTQITIFNKWQSQKCGCQLFNFYKSLCKALLWNTKQRREEVVSLFCTATNYLFYMSVLPSVNQYTYVFKWDKHFTYHVLFVQVYVHEHTYIYSLLSAPFSMSNPTLSAFML